jgi:hypothetical protein
MWGDGRTSGTNEAVSMSLEVVQKVGVGHSEFKTIVFFKVE